MTGTPNHSDVELLREVAGFRRLQVLSAVQSVMLQLLERIEAVPQVPPWELTSCMEELRRLQQERRAVDIAGAKGAGLNPRPSPAF